MFQLYKKSHLFEGKSASDNGKKAGAHRIKCTPAVISSFPTVSAFLLVLFLLLLLLMQTFTDGAFFSFLMEQVCHIPFAVVHHHRIVFLAVGSFHTVNGR